MASRMTASERREQVMAIAAKEFAQTGLHGTSAETIARRADITQPYIFRLFGNKTNLFNAVVEQAFDNMTQQMLNASQDLTGVEALMAMGSHYKTLVKDEVALLLQLQGFAACGDPKVRVVVWGAFERQWKAVADRSGLDPLGVKVFMSLGLLLNDLAALGVDGTESAWASHTRTPIPEDLYLAISTLSGHSTE